MSSTQHKLDKVRPPRVQITYDVDIGGAQTVKELPLIIGVMGDFHQCPLPLRERQFIQLDKDNFSSVMKSMKPETNLLVESVLPDIPGQLAVSLNFSSMEDFSPDAIVQQVEPLRQLIELREQLCDLRNRMASNERLKERVAEMIENQHSREGEKEGGKDE